MEKNKTPEEIIETIESRPFSGIFSRQTKLIEEISGGRYFRTSYGRDDLKKTLDKCSEVYPDAILKRAESIFSIQMERNIDYFITEDKKKILDQYEQRIKDKIGGVLVRRDNGDLLVSRNEKTEVSFWVKTDGNVEPMKDGMIISDNDILFNYNEEFAFYRDLYYALKDEKELKKPSMER